VPTNLITETGNEVVCEAVGCKSKANVEVRLKLEPSEYCLYFFATIAKGNSLLPVIMTWVGGNSVEWI
jgi:hypothetical protein